MATEKENNVLDEANLCRVIKANKALKGYNLTHAEIKAVLRAFADIVYTCVRYDIVVVFPTLGTFFKKIRKGFQGGYMPHADTIFEKGSSSSLVYYPPKPDFGVIAFEVKPSTANQFKEDTLLYGTEKKRSSGYVVEIESESEQE